MNARMICWALCILLLTACATSKTRPPKEVLGGIDPGDTVSVVTIKGDTYEINVEAVDEDSFVGIDTSSDRMLSFELKKIRSLSIKKKSGQLTEAEENSAFKLIGGLLNVLLAIVTLGQFKPPL